MGDFVSNPARTLTPIGGSQALSELTEAVLDLRAALLEPEPEPGTNVTITFLDHGVALPEASASLHGKIYVVSTGTPGADQAYWCMRTDWEAGTYAWVGLPSP